MRSSVKITVGKLDFDLEVLDGIVRLVAVVEGEDQSSARNLLTQLVLLSALLQRVLTALVIDGLVSYFDLVVLKKVPLAVEEVLLHGVDEIVLWLGQRRVYVDVR